MFALTNENIELRRTVETLTKKLNENNKQNNHLISENDNADIKVEQARDEIQRVKLLMKKREEELLSRLNAADIKYSKLSQEADERRS